jgi:hypothetical protein
LWGRAQVETPEANLAATAFPLQIRKGRPSPFTG